MGAVVSWNCKVGRHPQSVVAGLRGIIRDHDPEVVVLQEADEYVPAIRKAFNKHWYVYARNIGREGRQCPVMVRKAGHRRKYIKDGGWGTVHPKTRWEGPHGQPHEGRTWTWVYVSGAVVLSLHRCTGGRAKNKDAYLEEAKELIRFFARHAGRQILVFGDTNTEFGVVYGGSMQQVANIVHGLLTGDRPPGVDYMLSKGARGTVNRRKEYGSDHRAAVARGFLR